MQLSFKSPWMMGSTRAIHSIPYSFHFTQNHKMTDRCQMSLLYCLPYTVISAGGLSLSSAELDATQV